MCTIHSHCVWALVIIFTCCLTIAIVIGWEQLRYNTSETSRSVDLCASITSQAEIQLDPFTLNVQYMDISAGKFDNVHYIHAVVLSED